MAVRREAQLWLLTAKEDLEDAKEALERSRYFRAAFFAQQAAEKALKALFYSFGSDHPPPIHSVTELYTLLRERGFTLPQELESQLFVLNKYYTVTRYPDAASGLPSESVDKLEAERAVSLAGMVVDVAEKHSK